MSGGSLDYFYSNLEDHIGDFGDKELDELVKDLAALFHDREWYLSSDTCEGAWIESRDNFKAKWFGENSRSERIEKYLEEIKNDVLKQFGLSDVFCKNCKNWEQKDNMPYGKCKMISGCLMHRSECCHRFERRS